MGRSMKSIQGGKFWGKISGESRLSLLDHSLDVGRVFRSLCSLPVIHERLEAAAGQKLNDGQLDRLAVIATLHDIGKANLAFQNKVTGSRADKVDHITGMNPLFYDQELKERLQNSLNIETLQAWFGSDKNLAAFLLASWSHHGEPIRPDPCDKAGTTPAWWKPDGNRDPFREIERILAAAGKAFPAAFKNGTPPIPDQSELQHRFAGLVMLADWIGSHPRFFPLERPPGFDQNKAARKALRIIGMDSTGLRTALKSRSLDFDEIFGFSPRPFQQTLGRLADPDSDEKLLIAEAETGSGKTEAALFYFFRLFASGKVDGLYFALPTRVAANELHDRIKKYLEMVFPDSQARPIAVLAVPRYAGIGGAPDEQSLPDISPQDERPWAAEHPKRFLAATVAVGTIDQALLSTVQRRHAHLRSVCLDRSLLVVDEVHASDPYVRMLLRSLIAHHTKIGGFALLLSATLGSSAAQEYIKAAGGNRETTPLKQAITMPYPAITQAKGKLIAVKGTPESEKIVALSVQPWLEKPEKIIPTIVEALAAGARVMVVANTVHRAISLQRTIEQDSAVPRPAFFQCNGEIAPHHGRFAPVDRNLLDSEVTKRWGKNGPRGPALIIGTQTLEQSLDIDADLLITDLCPADVLLQRIGRLHRHRERDPSRPAPYSRPRCIVLSSECGDLVNLLDSKGQVNREAMSCGLGSVYEDLRVLELTRRLIEAHPEIRIPRDNRLVVEKTTHPDRLNSLRDDKWKRHAQQVLGIEASHRVQADFALINYGEPFYDTSFGELGKKAKTRLGLDTMRVILDRTITSPFGQNLQELIIPGHMLDDEITVDDKPVVSTVSEKQATFRLGGKQFKYSRFGLEEN